MLLLIAQVNPRTFDWFALGGIFKSQGLRVCSLRYNYRLNLSHPAEISKARSGLAPAGICSPSVDPLTITWHHKSTKLRNIGENRMGIRNRKWELSLGLF